MGYIIIKQKFIYADYEFDQKVFKEFIYSTHDLFRFRSNAKYMFYKITENILNRYFLKKFNK